jgi:small subunit ribosomal protein S19
MPRSVWKIPFSNSKVFKLLYFLKKNQTMFLRSRSSIIFPLFVGNTFLVYNGKSFVHLFVNENMIGFKFGDFIITKKRIIHKKK